MLPVGNKDLGCCAQLAPQARGKGGGRGSMSSMFYTRLSTENRPTPALPLCLP